MKRAEFIVGFLCSALLFGTTNAAAGLVATASDQMIFVNGRQVTMTAYNIGGNNYVKLRDIGEKVGFNVYWDGSVQVDSTAAYTGEAPEKEEQKQRSAIVTLTNEVRRENGLPPLDTDELLMQAAQVRAEEMAATGTYSHTRPDGSSRTTVTDCLYTAENIHCIRVSRPKEQGVELAELAVEEWAAYPPSALALPMECAMEGNVGSVSSCSSMTARSSPGWMNRKSLDLLLIF